MGELINILVEVKTILEHRLKPPELSGEGIVLSKLQVQTTFLAALPMFAQELLDISFFLPPLAGIEKIIAWDKANTIPYIPEHRDCDNYGMWMAAMVSMVFGVNPFFPIWDYDARHFYDLVLDAELKIYVLEPQTDQMWTLADFKPDALHQLRSGKIYGF